MTMPQAYHPAAIMAELERQAQRQAALENAFLQQAESSRLMSALLEQAVRWNVEPANRATRIVPSSIERASTGLWKTVSSGQVVPAGNWNGLPGDELVWTVDFIVQAKNGNSTSYPQPSSPVLPGFPSQPYDYSPYAIVVAGSGDVGGESFEVDIDTGGRIVLPGRNIAISLAMDAALATYASGTMTLGAYVGLFAATSVAPVKRTRRTGTITNGHSSATLLVPPRAKQVMPIRCSTTAATGTIHVQDASGADIDVWTFTSGSIVASVPLPLGAYQFVIDNTGAAPAAYQVPFQIAV